MRVGLFNENVIGETKKVLKGMEKPLRMTFFSQEMECEPCTSASLFVGEFTALDERLSVERKDFLADRELAKKLGVHHIPALLLHRPEDDRAALRYYGVPGGYEFGAFLRAILLFSTGRYEQPLDRESLGLIDREVNLKVFVLTTCPSCPVMAYLAGGLAFLVPRITTEIIDANSFVDLSTRYNVGAVPKIVIDDRTEVAGVLPPEELIKRIIAG